MIELGDVDDNIDVDEECMIDDDDRELITSTHNTNTELSTPSTSIHVHTTPTYEPSTSTDSHFWTIP